MNYLRQVRRGIDYIEANLHAEITPADVARHAGISHWHFQRIFRALTSETLKSYIRARRFSAALDRLATTDERILDIALCAGFESQESFTRAFKKAFSVTPAHYRKHHATLAVLRKLRIDEEYLRHLHRNITLEPVVYWQPPLLLVGMRTQFSVDAEKNNIAARLPPLWVAFISRLEEIQSTVPGMCFGVVRQPPGEPSQLEYYAATAVVAGGQVPRGMVVLELPETRYAKFTHKGKAQELDRTVSYIYSSWLVRSGMRHTYGADLEHYGPRYHPEAEHSEIDYAIPVASASS